MLILGAVCYILSLIYCITFLKYKTRSTHKIFQDLCFQKNYYVRIGVNRVANERYKIHLWGTRIVVSTSTFHFIEVPTISTPFFTTSNRVFEIRSIG